VRRLAGPGLRDVVTGRRPAEIDTEIDEPPHGQKSAAPPRRRYAIARQPLNRAGRARVTGSQPGRMGRLSEASCGLTTRGPAPPPAGLLDRTAKREHRLPGVRAIDGCRRQRSLRDPASSACGTFGHVCRLVAARKRLRRRRTIYRSGFDDSVRADRSREGARSRRRPAMPRRCRRAWKRTAPASRKCRSWRGAGTCSATITAMPNASITRPVTARPWSIPTPSISRT
jgi:hypothetical protein